MRFTLAQAWSLALAPTPNRIKRLATKKRALRQEGGKVSDQSRRSVKWAGCRLT